MRSISAACPRIDLCTKNPPGVQRECDFHMDWHAEQLFLQFSPCCCLINVMVQINTECVHISCEISSGLIFKLKGLAMIFFFWSGKAMNYFQKQVKIFINQKKQQNHQKIAEIYEKKRFFGRPRQIFHKRAT